MVSALIKGSRSTIILDYESEYFKMALKILKKSSFMVEIEKVLPILVRFRICERMHLN